MKLIVAFIQPFRLDAVTRALREIPEFPGASIAEIEGFGQAKSVAGEHSTAEDLLDYSSKVRLESVVRDDQVAAVGEAIREAAHTGNRGDGKVFVLDVESATRIRTGETGDPALWSPLHDPDRLGDSGTAPDE